MPSVAGPSSAYPRKIRSVPSKWLKLNLTAEMVLELNKDMSRAKKQSFWICMYVYFIVYVLFSVYGKWKWRCYTVVIYIGVTKANEPSTLTFQTCVYRSNLIAPTGHMNRLYFFNHKLSEFKDRWKKRKNKILIIYLSLKPNKLTFS